MVLSTEKVVFEDSTIMLSDFLDESTSNPKTKLDKQHHAEKVSIFKFLVF